MTRKRKKTEFDPCWLTPLMFTKNSNFAKMRFDKNTTSREFFNSMKRIGEHGLLETLIMDFRDKALSFLESNNLPTSYENLSALSRTELDALPVEAKHIYEMLHSFYVVQEKIKEKDAEMAAWNMAKGILSAMRAEIRPIEPFFEMGKLNVDGGKTGGEKSGEIRRKKTKPAKELWQAEAEKIWRKHPTWNKSDTAREIIKSIGGNLGTIRKFIQKPLP